MTPSTIASFGATGSVTLPEHTGASPRIVTVPGADSDATITAQLSVPIGSIHVSPVPKPKSPPPASYYVRGRLTPPPRRGF